VGGAVAIAARALPGGETVSAKAAGTQAGAGVGQGGAQTGTLTGGQQQEASGPVTNVYISGPIYGGEEGLRELVGDISDAVGGGDVVLHATSASMVIRRS
jgi:hypothetical protein